jgi:hypothetical protein
MIPWTLILGWAKRFWPYLAAAAALLVVGMYLHHRWYAAGYDQAQAEYQAAAMKAGVEFAKQLAERDAALAAAQGKVVEVVKWKTKTQTIYQEAVTNDPDCKAWASEPIRCALGPDTLTSTPSIEGVSSGVP